MKDGRLAAAHKMNDLKTGSVTDPRRGPVGTPDDRAIKLNRDAVRGQTELGDEIGYGRRLRQAVRPSVDPYFHRRTQYRPFPGSIIAA